MKKCSLGMPAFVQAGKTARLSGGASSSQIIHQLPSLDLDSMDIMTAEGETGVAGPTVDGIMAELVHPARGG